MKILPKSYTIQNIQLFKKVWHCPNDIVWQSVINISICVMVAIVMSCFIFIEKSLHFFASKI